MSMASIFQVYICFLDFLVNILVHRLYFILNPPDPHLSLFCAWQILNAGGLTSRDYMDRNFSSLSPVFYEITVWLTWSKCSLWLRLWFRCWMCCSWVRISLYFSASKVQSCWLLLCNSPCSCCKAFRNSWMKQIPLILLFEILSEFIWAKLTTQILNDLPCSLLLRI